LSTSSSKEEKILQSAIDEIRQENPDINFSYYGKELVIFLSKRIGKNQIGSSVKFDSQVLSTMPKEVVKEMLKRSIEAIRNKEMEVTSLTVFRSENPSSRRYG